MNGFKKWLSIIKNKSSFEQICRMNGIQLDYASNADGKAVLEEIFIQRGYADYFPFYQKVTILDIGAHFGYFSLFAAKHVSEGSLILAVEPSMYNYKNLVKNSTQNQLQSIVPIHAAVGAHDGEIELFLSASMNHSILPKLPAADGGKGIEKVAMTTVETLVKKYKLERIDFMKIDCEGAEYDILTTCTDDIYQKIQTISLEFHDGKTADKTGLYLTQLLREKGYEICQYKHSPSRQNLNYGRIIATRR